MVADFFVASRSQNRQTGIIANYAKHITNVPSLHVLANALQVFRVARVAIAGRPDDASFLIQNAETIFDGSTIHVFANSHRVFCGAFVSPARRSDKRVRTVVLVDAPQIVDVRTAKCVTIFNGCADEAKPLPARWPNNKRVARHDALRIADPFSAKVTAFVTHIKALVSVAKRSLVVLLLRPRPAVTNDFKDSSSLVLSLSK
mmetsp:Transcript_9659/g.14212  ORF Transcript_9659/g.14212 Transcript_9659/m.14212 type:complete len:202 (-) Transcript_9659:135-740(-)